MASIRSGLHSICQTGGPGVVRDFKGEESDIVMECHVARVTEAMEVRSIQGKDEF